MDPVEKARIAEETAHPKVVVPVPDETEQHPDPYEDGESSIPGTRPRFGWQSGETVIFSGENGEPISREAWERKMDEKRKKLGGPRKPVFRNPMSPGG